MNIMTASDISDKIEYTLKNRLVVFNDKDKYFEIKRFREDKEFIYDFSLGQCDNTDKLVRWIRQLSSKTWITREHICELIDTYSSITNFFQFGV